MSSSVRLALATVAITVAGMTAPIAAVRQQPSSDRVLPDFDIREGRAPQAPSPQTQAEAQRARENGQSRLREHPFTSGVRVLDRPGVNVRRNISAAALQNVVASLAERLGLENGDLSSLTVLRDYVTSSNGLRTVTFSQVVDDVPVFDAVVSLHISQSGEIVRITSSAGRTAAKQQAVRIAVEQAVKAAAANIRPELSFSPARVPDARGTARFARGPFRRDLTASLAWLPVDGVLRLAWQVMVQPDSDSEVYDVLIDATTGDVLLRRNRVHFVEGSGRVMQSPAMNALDPRRLDPTPIGQPGSSCPPASNYLVRSLNAPFRDPSATLSTPAVCLVTTLTSFLHDTSIEGARERSTAPSGISTFRLTRTTPPKPRSSSR